MWFNEDEQHSATWIQFTSLGASGTGKDLMIHGPYGTGDGCGMMKRREGATGGEQTNWAGPRLNPRAIMGIGEEERRVTA